MLCWTSVCLQLSTVILLYMYVYHVCPCTNMHMHLQIGTYLHTIIHIHILILYENMYVLVCACMYLKWPRSTAMYKGVSPFSFFDSIRAPLSVRNFTNRKSPIVIVVATVKKSYLCIYLCKCIHSFNIISCSRYA
jgi:hypothetical protein